MVKPVFTEDDIKADPVVVIDERKFFKTTITVEVISEGAPMDCVTDPRELYTAMVNSPCSGDIKITAVEELTPVEATAALMKQNSDPELFGLEGQEDKEGRFLDKKKEHKFARIVFENQVPSNMEPEEAAKVLQSEIECLIQDHGVLPDDVEMHDRPYRGGGHRGS